jgi:tRNA modification GTPase
MLHVIQLTPPGRGAIATLRVEGPGAADAVQVYFRTHSGRPLAAHPVDRLVVGHFADDCGEEVVVRRCAGSAVELHCHGGYATVAMIEEALVAAGCQRMTWRDWTAATHPDDPIAAAALTALADARTERTAAILLDQYHGALRSALDEIRRSIDRGADDAVGRQVNVLLGRADLGQHLVRPWSVVLAGRVNVGKSSLINALTGYGRSIVHHAAGTTRDAVTAATAIDGWPVELCDTAGLRTGGDAVERAGVQRAEERLARADLAILVFDQNVAWSAEDQSLLDRWPAALLVHNKCDLPATSAGRPAGLWTSALRGDGIEELLQAIARRLVPDPPPPGAAVPFTPQQVEMVYRLAETIENGCQT